MWFLFGGPEQFEKAVSNYLCVGELSLKFEQNSVIRDSCHKQTGVLYTVCGLYLDTDSNFTCKILWCKDISKLCNYRSLLHPVVE